MASEEIASTLISRQFYMADQSWIHERIIKYKSDCFRIYIRRNAADFQSFVRGYALDRLSNSWQLIVDRPIKTAACFLANYAAKADQTLFEKDSTSVLIELIQIFE